MTSVLGAALVLSVLSGVAASALFLVWPRRLSAEEWIVHRRSYARAAVVSGTGPWPRVLTGGASVPRLGGLVRLSDADRALLELAGARVPTEPEAVTRRLVWLAAVGAVAGIVVATALGLTTGATWLALAAPLIGLIAALTLPGLQLASWRYSARSLRTDFHRRLPRLLTGARVLLESGGATAEGALSAAVATYADPAADVFREALRLKEVRRLELEAAMDEVSDRYAIRELRRLADNFRIGHRYGTGMSALLADFAKAARESWHAQYRQRITRAPVLMTVPALIFFVLPLLVLVMFLVFTPLMGTLGRL